ncbi:hypothetical protein GCM10007933_27080 [Zoogloea oryzae]|uniref:GspL cytoplasmic actin-ATPase-like domain-containing protein n=1 Tax=Zoogloea oryzae TaxID=310767 RepID=A0ABQ6FD83_9RHOO|nr:hypothetical protein [Zoogloea oryzae]GLT23244.1 hypothetical protein GCM10007933_27080 [Zoogloea oryzae]
MADRRILHLSAAGLASHAPGASAADSHFAPDADGLARFATYLTAHARTRFTLLIDLPDELFSTETIPPLRGRDRLRLLARRQERLGAGVTHVTRLSLGTRNTSKPEESVLLAALTRPESLRPWFDALTHAGSIVTSAHSIPFVGMALLAHLPPAAYAPDAPQLLASLGPAGLRVSCYSDGKLRFSRLTPAGADPWASCHPEIQRTRQYLHAQRILGHDMPPQIRVLAHPDHHATIRNNAPDGIDCVDLVALAHNCGAPPPIGSDSLPLLIQLLARAPRLPAIHVPALGRAQRIARIGQAAILGTALVVGASFALGAANYMASQESDAQSTQLRTQITDAQRLLDQARAAIPPTPHPPAAIHATHARAVRLHAAADIDTRLNAVSRAFDQHPQIELDRLEWTLNPTDPDPALTIRLHINLPIQGANTLAETFAATLQTTTQATATIDPTGTPAADAKQRQPLVVRIDFPPSAP